MSMEKNFLEAVKELRGKSIKERKFDQTIDLIVNLKDFDVKRQGFNVFIEVPHKIKDKKVAGFLEKSNKSIYSINKSQFVSYKEKKDIKKLVNNYDFFVANAKLMPLIATNFGRVLGPIGKMPSPQLGIITNEDESIIKSIIEKINKNVRIIVKQPSIKVGVARFSLSDNEIVDNLIAVFGKILSSLPKGTDNIKNIKIKLTMSKPIDIKLTK